MKINWSDPSKNDPKDVDALRQFIADTDPTVNHSDLYRPRGTAADRATATPQTQPTSPKD